MILSCLLSFLGLLIITAVSISKEQLLRKELIRLKKPKPVPSKKTHLRSISISSTKGGGAVLKTESND